MSIKNMYNFIKEIWKQNENIPSQCPICTVAWKRRAAILLVKHHCIVLMFRVFTALYQHQGFPQEFVNVCLPTGLKTGLHGSSHLKIVGSCWRTEFLKIAFFYHLGGIMFLWSLKCSLWTWYLMSVLPLSRVSFLPWWRCSCFPETHTGLNTTGSRWC